MRALVVVHRWLGVAFCLLFAMWFVTGAIMHWVPFPELTEDERLAGLSTFSPTTFNLSPILALETFKRDDVARLRLTAPGGRATYIATLADNTLLAVDANTGAAPSVNETFALASARAHAESRGLIKIAPQLVETASYDQWTVSN